MRKLILCCALLGLLPAESRAGIILGTSNPASDPLNMSAGGISAPISVTVSSDSSDVMSAWQLILDIVPNGGATGSLAFQNPATGTAPNPPGYIFGTNGLGITATNSGNQLFAFDFDVGDLPGGATVPSAGSNLLQVSFSASGDASGTFGIYAVDGVNNTSWSPPFAAATLFTNVPDDAGMTLVGDVMVSPSVVPEPSTLTLAGICFAILAVWYARRRSPLALGPTA